MKKLVLKGIVTPLVTPFTTDASQEVNESVLREIIDFQLEGGVHALFVCGANGEGVYLSPDEIKKVTEVTVDQVNGKVPVITGVQPPDTRTAVALAKDAKECGGDGVAVLTPHYYPPTNEGLIEHYQQVAENADIPIMIYSLPRYSGYDPSPEVISDLANIENIVALKDCSHDIVKLAEEIELCKDRITILYGGFPLFLPILALGGHGCITGFENVLPRMHVDLFDAFQRGNFERARELYFQILPIVRIGPNPTNVKAALNILGFNVGFPRKPLLPAQSEKIKKLTKILTELQHM